jgi:hypothetical protein
MFTEIVLLLSYSDDIRVTIMHLTPEQKKTARISLIAGLLLVIPLLLFMASLFSGREYLVGCTDGTFFRARSIIIAANCAVMKRDRARYTSKKEALDGVPASWRLSVIGMKHINLIEATVMSDDNYAVSDGWRPALRDYIGKYRINAAGNNGFLFIGASGGALYGSIRFPDWGRGAVEPLKSIGIVNGKLRFIRSVTTQREMGLTGASGYFIQEYSGEYRQSGKMIKGYYTVRGQRKYWEAYKI